MSYTEGLMKGTSLCFTQSLSYESMKELHDAGIDCAEISFNFDKYMKEFDFPNRAEEYAENASRAGLMLWSIHLPFSRKLDISNFDDEMRNLIMETNETLIRAAGRVGVKVAVLHPSSEPISDDVRAERLRLSHENIIKLRKVCDEYNMILAVENLPRTCLCNRSDEMISLLKDTGASVVFDTNHSLIEQNTYYLNNLIANGLNIASLHISDYDFVDERHRLPGDGYNNWHALLASLENAGYKGPLMYEVPAIPKERERITLAQLAENMRLLAADKI